MVETSDPYLDKSFQKQIIGIFYHADDNKRMIEHYPSLMDQLSESSAWRPSAPAPSPQSHQPIRGRSLQKSSLNGISIFQMLLRCFRQLCISWMLTLYRLSIFQILLLCFRQLCISWMLAL
jgi:hypothetical protein